MTATRKPRRFVGVLLTERLEHKLNALAEATHRNRSEVLRALLDRAELSAVVDLAVGPNGREDAGES